jgi:mannose-6-phosphate isomerase-like protein (cupin superfamily)
MLQTVTARKFSMNGLQLLSSGQSTQPLVAAENLWMHSKVYSRGGENALHAHVTEDHAFFVLAGAAEFTFGDADTVEAGRYEGVMIPKGTQYRFEALGSENLVMIRIGAAAEATPYVKKSFGLAFEPSSEPAGVVDPTGKAIVDTTSLSKGKTPAEPVIPIRGRTFPEV